MKYITLAVGTTVICLFIILTVDELASNGILLDSRESVLTIGLVGTFILFFLKLYPYLLIKDK